MGGTSTDTGVTTLGGGVQSNSPITGLNGGLGSTSFSLTGNSPATNGSSSTGMFGSTGALGSTSTGLTSVVSGPTTTFNTGSNPRHRLVVRNILYRFPHHLTHANEICEIVISAG